MVEDINNYILELASEFPTLHGLIIFLLVSTEFVKSLEPPRLISNSSLFETLNLKVVGRKIESIANTIVYPMNEEMTKLVGLFKNGFSLTESLNFKGSKAFGGIGSAEFRS
jgi:hypothetical protein